MRALRAMVVAVLLASQLAAAVAFAAGEALPVKNQAVLLMRVLLYDRNLAARASDSVARVVVVSRAADPASRMAGDAMTQTLNQLAKRAVLGGRKIVVLQVGPEQLGEALARDPVSAVYLAPGLPGRAALLKATEKARVLTFSADPENLEAGASIGFVQRAERITIIVNLKRARAEGADLDSALLALAEVVN